MVVAFCFDQTFLSLKAKAPGRTPEDYEKKGDLTGVSCPTLCHSFLCA